MFDDDEKKKKKKDKISKNESGKKIVYNNVETNTRKRKSLLAAIGNTDAFQKHIDRKDERIWDRRYAEKREYESYNKEMNDRNKRLAEKGINARHSMKYPW